ncbi:hypothetical protein V8F06_009246 [Rhypophila decipiens]
MSGGQNSKWENSRVPKRNGGARSPMIPTLSGPQTSDEIPTLSNNDNRWPSRAHTPTPPSPAEDEQLKGGRDTEGQDEMDSAGSDPQSDCDSDDSVGNPFDRGITFHASSDRTIRANPRRPVKDDTLEFPPVTENEFYSNLVFLSILRPTLGPAKSRERDLEYIETDDKKPGRKPSPVEIQRDFLDRLCYLADYRKGGDTITAAAVQWEFIREFGSNRPRPGWEQDQLPPPQSTPTQTIWFAANAGVSKPAWDALQAVENLINNNRTGEKGKEELEQELLKRFVDLASCDNHNEAKCCYSRERKKTRGEGTHRLNFYAKGLRRTGKNVRLWLEAKETESAEVRNWIEDLRTKNDEVDLVIACYQCWFEEPAKSFLKRRKLPESNPDFSRDLKEFAHLVARIGAFKYAVMKVAAGIKELSYMTDQRCLIKFNRLPKGQHHEAIKPMEIDLSTAFGWNSGYPDGEPDPLNIVHKISKWIPGDSGDLAKGYFLEEQRRGEQGGYTFSFRGEIKNWITKKRDRAGVLVTRYHAELQIANYFNAMGLRFQDKDRYIGCSKPACWFCAQYLQIVPDLRGDEPFVPPPQHNEVLPGVRFPPTDDVWAARVRSRMNQVVLESIREALLGNIPQFPKNKQSTDTWMDRTTRSSWMEEEEIRSVA